MQVKRIFSSVAAATALVAAVASSPAQAVLAVPVTEITSGYFDAPGGDASFTVGADSFATLGLLTDLAVIKTVGLTDVTTGSAVAYDHGSFFNSDPSGTAGLFDTVTLNYDKLLGGHTYKLSWTTLAGTAYELHATYGVAQVASVPEPEVYSLAFAGLVVAVLAVRRRQRAEA